LGDNLISCRFGDGDGDEDTHAVIGGHLHDVRGIK
jgi:hypothetical protein